MFYLVKYDVTESYITFLITWSKSFQELVYFYYKQYGSNYNKGDIFAILDDKMILECYGYEIA